MSNSELASIKVRTEMTVSIKSNILAKVKQISPSVQGFQAISNLFTKLVLAGVKPEEITSSEVLTHFVTHWPERLRRFVAPDWFEEELEPHGAEMLASLANTLYTDPLLHDPRKIFSISRSPHVHNITSLRLSPTSPMDERDYWHLTRSTTLSKLVELGMPAREFTTDVLAHISSDYSSWRNIRALELLDIDDSIETAMRASNVNGESTHLPSTRLLALPGAHLSGNPDSYKRLGKTFPNLVVLSLVNARLSDRRSLAAIVTCLIDSSARVLDLSGAQGIHARSFHELSSTLETTSIEEVVLDRHIARYVPSLSISNANGSRIEFISRADDRYRDYIMGTYHDVIV